MPSSWKPLPARPNLLRGADRRLLDQAEQFLSDEQWDDAVEALMRLIESEDQSVVEVAEHHFVSLREYCQLLLLQLPNQPLDRYRQLVDPAAESWYREGIERHDMSKLQKVVDHYIQSSWGDNALYAIGELQLQRGHYQAARNAWSRVSVHPSTEFSESTIQARQVLAWIREAHWQQAEETLAQLASDYPDARGRMGGREVVFAEYLKNLLIRSQASHRYLISADSRTFAANPTRTNSQPFGKAVGPYELLWSRTIENNRLASFPIVAEGLIVMQNDTSVVALHLKNGEQEFAASGGAFQSPSSETYGQGTPLHTLTVDEGLVYGIKSAPVGLTTSRAAARSTSTLWGLDLRREGAIAIQLMPDEPSISFVGAPLVVDKRAYVPIHSNGQSARAGIACYDLSTERLEWQRWICQANTPATSSGGEIANRLLAYDAGVLYANTNLGAVAAMQASNGSVLWVHTYERKSPGVGQSQTQSYYRGPSTCMYHAGSVFVLPTDGNSVLALDAGTGSVRWRHPVENRESRLLGVNFERLVIFDGELQSLQFHNGSIAGANNKSINGWPVLRERDSLSEMFIQLNGAPEGMIHSLDVTNLSNHDDGFSALGRGGANLLLAGKYLVAAGRSTLSVYQLKKIDQDAANPADEPTKE